MQNRIPKTSRMKCAAAIAVAWGLGAGATVGTPATAAAGDSSSNASSAEILPVTKPHLDRSGHRQIGKASFYKNSYSGKKMADGTPMQLYSDNAASRTLPLGTTARVTNLETGRSAVVTIRDRGPYIKGRIVDLSPSTARKIGLERKKGLAKVEVAPLTIPLVDGTVKIGPVMAAN
jgi:rare lipoprotein A